MYLEISLPHSKRVQRYKGTLKICKSPLNMVLVPMNMGNFGFNTPKILLFMF